MNSKVPFVLTALCASVGLAQAQSVEVFGVLDVAYLSTTATDSPNHTMLVCMDYNAGFPLFAMSWMGPYQAWAWVRVLSLSVIKPMPIRAPGGSPKAFS